jgi:hypothetical protein
MLSARAESAAMKPAAQMAALTDAAAAALTDAAAAAHSLLKVVLW